MFWNCPVILELALVGAAIVLDYAIGDPWHWPHPVQFIGAAIQNISAFALRYCHRPIAQSIAGIGLMLAIVIGSIGIVQLVIQIAIGIHPGFGWAIEVVILASCFAGRSLRDAANDVLRPFNLGEWTEARSRLSRYVGRDTANLTPAEILRATLETVAENGVDGVMAPLFWAIVGIFAPGSPALWAIGFKAASTLDSMVGYKRAPYRYLGTASAKVDDGLTYLPCRLTVLSLGILSGNPIAHWRNCQKDGSQDPSPNSGWSECAYALTLDVQLGGMNTYQGQEKFKPFLGQPNYPITTETIAAALSLNRRMIWSWFCLASAVCFAYAIGGCS